MNETALSTLSVLPSNRDQLRTFSRQLKDEILAGNTDPLKALIQLKFAEKLIEDVLKDAELDHLFVKEKILFYTYVALLLLDVKNLNL